MLPWSEAPAECEVTLAGAVGLCQADEHFLASLRDLYDGADRAIASTGAICAGGGACCRFDLMDHRLYLTAGELALLVHRHPADAIESDLGRCPYQLGPRCTARRDRPLGCRTFFCDRTRESATRQIHEEFHTRITLLHQRHCLPYRYAELLAGLMQLSAVSRLR
jgi:Fe-S-cluster containining protein